MIQIATYMGSQVKEIYVKPHEPIAKGAPLYKMDAAPTQARLEQTVAYAPSDGYVINLQSGPASSHA